MIQQDLLLIRLLFIGWANLAETEHNIWGDRDLHMYKTHRTSNMNFAILLEIIYNYFRNSRWPAFTNKKPALFI